MLHNTPTILFFHPDPQPDGGIFQTLRPKNQLEKEIISAAFNQVRERKTFYTLIDDAHLLDIQVMRKLRLLFEQFPRNHNLVLFGQHDLLYFLSMTVIQDIKSRITYSQKLLLLADPEMCDFIAAELTPVKLRANAFDDSAILIQPHWRSHEDLIKQQVACFIVPGPINTTILTIAITLTLTRRKRPNKYVLPL